MQNQLRREAVSPKGLLVRLDHAAGTMNAFLLVFAIGLAALDLTCLWILTVRDAVPSVQLDPRFPVIPVRALANDGSRRFVEVQRDLIERFNRGEIAQKDAQLEIEHFWAGALRRAVVDGDVEHGSVMAGQSVGMVTQEQPTAEILTELVDQALAAMTARGMTGRPAQWGEAGS